MLNNLLSGTPLPLHKLTHSQHNITDCIILLAEPVLLKYHTHLPRNAFHRSPISTFQSGQQTQQCGFACSGRCCQQVTISPAKRQAVILKHLHTSVGFTHMGNSHVTVVPDVLFFGTVCLLSALQLISSMPLLLIPGTLRQVKAAHSSGYRIWLPLVDYFSQPQYCLFK